MSIDIGLVGLPKSGKTTIFNALTKGTADTGSYIAESPSPHIGVAKVPEPRLQVLADMVRPKRIVPAEVRYIDIGASVKSLVEKKGIGGEILNRLSNADMLINVVRAFTDDSLPHTEGSLDVDRDITTMDLELIFSDLAIIERRIDRLQTTMKGAKSSERPALLLEQETLLKLKSDLEKEVPLRELEMTPIEARLIANYQLLTAKPLLTVVNIGEEQLAEVTRLEAELNAHHTRKKCRVITLCGKLEMELSQLDEEAAADFRADFGIKESGLDRVIKLSYELLGLISFLTMGPDEARAWSIQDGTSALKAAGKIHSDIEKGFIRAEVVSYDDLIAYGNLAEARKKGRLRLEGKEYSIQDGDVINFLFNV